MWGVSHSSLLVMLYTSTPDDEIGNTRDKSSNLLLTLDMLTGWSESRSNTSAFDS